jgi:hypothetical protein
MVCLRSAARWGAAVIISAAALGAQTFLDNPLTTTGVNQSGFHIYDISAFTGYSTVDKSWKTVVQSLTGTTLPNLPSYSTLSGASASMGFHVSGGDGGKGSFSVIYSPSFSYTTYGQSWSAMTHTLALSWDVKLAPRWRFIASGSGVTGSFDQILFSPNSEQSLAAFSGTAGQLAGTVLSGQVPSQAAVSPQQRLLYGDRMLSAIVSMGLSYAHSPRLSFGFTASANRMQHVREHNGSVEQNYYLVPATTNAAAALSIGYMLSPRTTISTSASYGRTLSAFSQAQYTSANFGVGRRLTQRWFTQFAAGGIYILPVGRISTGVHGKQYEADGGLGYRATTYTVIVSAHRSVSDYYGMGPAATVGSALGWSWQRVGSHWAVMTGVSQDHLLGSQFSSSGVANNSLRTTFGIHWSPYRRASILLQYAYASFSGAFPFLPQGPGQQLRFAQHSIRLNFGMGTGGTGAGGGPGGAGVP